MKLNLSQILEATQGELLSGSTSEEILSISTDSRSINKGDLFLCLSGPNFDGHEFIDLAIGSGAIGILLKKSKWDVKKWENKNCFFIGVEDPLVAFGNIARLWRRQFTIPIVAITGSNGKTTTKDLVEKILSQVYHPLATEGNLNNLIGVPKTLLRLIPEHTAAVIEMGMNDFGEIKRLAEIAEPTIGLITNVGYAHVEKLKGLEGVAKAKGELFSVLPPGTIALINQDDPNIVNLPTRAYRISFGIEKGGDVSCTKYKLSENITEFEIRHLGKKYLFRSPLLGLANLKNLVAAVAVGFALGIEAEKIQKALLEFTGRAMRMEIIPLKEEIVILNDCYNANPTSTQVAVETLSLLKKKKPGLAVIGEMLELGDFSAEGHRKVGRSIAENKIGYLIAIGPHASQVIEGALEEGFSSENCLATSSQDEIKEILPQWAKVAKVILIKGSRGAHMERITEYLKNLFK